MNIKDIVPIDWSNRRVLTTAQLAQTYGCSIDRIKDNFNANKKHYKEGVHYFKIVGSDLQKLRVRYPYLIISPMTRTFYLWTASGIFLHCKSINTPQAWELFNQIGIILSSENHSALDKLIFGKIKPSEAKPDEAYVYALEFDNGWVKIGMSNDVDARKGNIRRKLQLTTLRSYHSDFMPRKKAHQIETTCHKSFADRLVYRREYFDIPFEDACFEINRRVAYVKSSSLIADKQD